MTESRFFVARGEALELPGFIRAVFEHVRDEGDFQPGLKCSGCRQVVAALEHARRLPGDRARLLLKPRVLMVEVTARIAEGSSLRQETPGRKQGAPCFLNARRQIFRRAFARRLASCAASQEIGQGYARSTPDSLDLMIHIAEKRRPVKLFRRLL